MRTRRARQLTENHTSPSPTATPRGRPPTWMRSTTRFVVGSTRTIDRVRGSATQTEPSPTATPDGSPPIGIVTSAVLVLGSIRLRVPVPTVFGGQQWNPGRATTQTAPASAARALGITRSGIVADTAPRDVGLSRTTPPSVPTHSAPWPAAIPDAPATPPAVPVLNEKAGSPTPNVSALFVVGSILATDSRCPGLTLQIAPAVAARLPPSPYDPNPSDPAPSGIDATTSLALGSIRASCAAPPPPGSLDETRSQT